MSTSTAARPVQDQQLVSSSTSSTPQDIPTGSNSHQRSRGTRSNAGNTGPGPSASSSSFGTSPSDSHGNGMRKQRYGKWPVTGTTPPGRSNSSGSRPGDRQMSRTGSSSSGVRSFSWPAYMDRQQLQQAMKRGQVFRWGPVDRLPDCCSDHMFACMHLSMCGDKSLCLWCICMLRYQHSSGSNHAVPFYRLLKGSMRGDSDLPAPLARLMAVDGRVQHFTAELAPFLQAGLLST